MGTPSLQYLRHKGVILEFSVLAYTSSLSASPLPSQLGSHNCYITSPFKSKRWGRGVISCFKLLGARSFVLEVRWWSGNRVPINLYQMNVILCLYKKGQGTKALLVLSKVSVQFSCSVVSDSLWPHGLLHTRPPCPSPAPRAYSNSCPLSRWCHPTILSPLVPFSSCLQSFPASGSFPMSQFFSSGGQSIGVSASMLVLPMNVQDYFQSWLRGGRTQSAAPSGPGSHILPSCHHWGSQAPNPNGPQYPQATQIGETRSHWLQPRQMTRVGERFTTSSKPGPRLVEGLSEDSEALKNIVPSLFLGASSSPAG